MGGGMGTRSLVGRYVNMTWVYIVSGILAGGLLIYLAIALLKPEWFA
jgi:K+-transporting ATPase KdpF subunit